MMAPVILAVRQQQQLVNKTPEKVILYLEPFSEGMVLNCGKRKSPPIHAQSKRAKSSMYTEDYDAFDSQTVKQ